MRSLSKKTLEKRLTLMPFPAPFLSRIYLFVASVLLLSATIGHAQDSGYRVIRRIPIGGEVAWNNLNLDPDAHRIYALVGTHIVVLDVLTGRLIGDIPITSGAHDIALAPDLGKGFVSSSQTNTISAFDLKTLKLTSEMKTTGKGTDSIIYDPATKRVFTFNSLSNNSTVVDATTEKVIGTVTLGGSPGGSALDGNGNVFVNLQNNNSVAKFDTKTLAIKNTWSIAPCNGPSGLSMDSTNRRLFAACDKAMAVVNADTGKVVASRPIGGVPEGNDFDPATGLIFLSSSTGQVSIIHQDTPDRYSSLGRVATQSGARSIAVDPKTHHLFVATSEQTPVIQELAPGENYYVVRIFYATDRKNTGVNQPEMIYGGDRSQDESLSLGSLDVSIPRDHRIGEIERPSALRLEFREDPNKHMVLLSVSPKPEAAFFNELSASVTSSASREAFVFIHGYDVTFADAARRTAQLAYDLRFDGAPILYSWPSKGQPAGYPADEATTDWTTPHLKKFLEQIASRSHATTVHLIAHSMGGRPLVNALKDIGEEHSGIPSAFRQVFLAAPDIDTDVFRQLAQTFPSVADRVTLYASSRDTALMASKRFHQNPRAGDTGSSIVIVPRVDTIDATAVDTSFLGHVYYDNRSILSDIFHLMHKNDPPDSRFGMQPIKRQNLTYWVFRP